MGEGIARKIPGDVLHVLVHDDDVMAYWLWRGGKLVDSYFSKPGYFNKKDLKKQVKMSGNPKLFGKYAPDAVPEIQQLLAREEDAPVFEVDRLKRFGELLDIANLVASYEYLEDGELDEIRGGNKFIEVPANIKRKLRSESPQAGDPSEHRKPAAGTGPKPLIEEVRQMVPHVARAGDGLLVAWARADGEPQPVQLYRAPWREAKEIDITPGEAIECLASDDAGRIVAMTVESRAVVVETSSWKRLLEIEAFGPKALALSNQELLAYAIPQELVVKRIADGALLMRAKVQFSSSIAIHPSGWIVSSGPAIRIARIGLNEAVRDLYVGGIIPHDKKTLEVMRSQYKEMDVDQMERDWQKNFGPVSKKLRKMGMSERDIEKSRKAMLEQMAAMRVAVQKAREGSEFMEPSGQENPACVGFSNDGRWLFCGTDRGMRVYDWQTVINTPKNERPQPKWKHDSPALETGQSLDFVYSLASEPNGTGVLFGGLSGIVFRMDLSTGTTMQLFTMPDEVPVMSMLFSADGAVLATTCFPGIKRNARRPDTRQILRLWDYLALTR
ncbi:MAG TPA: hypothetical protein VGQ99_17565 [Tepidisphaeraceae bacterium]|nr:hypothetical protein [Tepidisphaeraceae bacterium]